MNITQKEKKIIAHTNKWFHEKETKPFFLKSQLYGLFNKDQGFRESLEQLFDSLKESNNLDGIPDTCSPDYSLINKLRKNTDKKTRQEIDRFIKESGLHLDSIVEDIYFSFIFFNSKYWKEAITSPISKSQLTTDLLELLEEVHNNGNDPHVAHLIDSQRRSLEKNKNSNDFDNEVLNKHPKLPVLLPALYEGMGELLGNLHTVELNNLSFTWDISNETPASFKKRILENVEREIDSQISGFNLPENSISLTKLGNNKHIEWLYEKIKGRSWEQIKIKYGEDHRETVISGVKRVAKIIGFV